MSWNAKKIAEAAAMVALSALLHVIKIYHLPQGGSVTAGSMVPILFLSIRRGPALGAVAGAAFGMIQYFLDPFFVHPVQLLLDYPMAMASLGLAGFFKKRPIGGVTVALVARFLCHFVSGVVFFASYAPKGSNVLAYSAVYNASYILPELVISAIIVSVLAGKVKLD
ncbi:MAG TPA: energy-coupled thiamine transporter ThiT [Firmicutes bacterium]|nr:energy-coupled thiamine transporter ThiT [Bacillota bacterium]